VGYVCISHSRKNIKSRCEYYGSRTTGILRNPDKGLTSFDSRTSRVIRFYRFDFGHQLPLTHAANPRPFVLRDIICLFKYSLLCFNLSNFPHRNLLFPKIILPLFFMTLCYTYEISFYQKLISLSTVFAVAVSLYTNKVISYQILVLSFISKS